MGESDGDALAPRSLETPAASRLDEHAPGRDEILARHAAALATGATTYADPATGNEVFTAAFLAARGRCCGAGCRHCPYVLDA